MSITGISAISGEQLIAAGALSARSAGTASYTTGGNDIQGLYNTVSDNSASWTGGGSVSITSPSGTILVTDGDKVDGTNSAVALGVVEAGFGPTMYVIPNYITQIQPSWTECFSNLSCPTSGGTIEFNLVGAGEKTIYLSGMDLNWQGVETAATVTLEGNPAHIVLPLGPIVTHCQAKTNGDWLPFSEQSYTASKADTYGPTGIGELAWNSAVTNVVNTVSSNSASWGGGASYTGDAQGALDEVYSNSGTWNTVTNKLDSTAFSTVSGNFLTAHQALSDSANWNSTYNSVSNNSATWNTVTDKLDSTAFSTVSGDYLTAVPVGTMNESNFAYDASDNITAYNGSAFKAGGDVPTGVMAESGLEFNAANEISGYNGSAIAQNGAEKQWLVHDDTMLHIANSAQYALGVNISAVAQLMGVDQTLLFSASTPTSAAELSESLYNFNSLKIYFDMGMSDRPKTVIEMQPNANMTCGWGQGAENAYYTVVRLKPTDDTHLVVDRGKSVNLGNFTATAAATVTAQTGAAYQNVIKKIVGVGRIS